MPLATGLFGTHVGGRPGVSWPLADILLPQGQSKIRYERLAALIEQDVAGLDVPMDDTLLVGIVQSLAYGSHQLGIFFQGKARRFDLRLQGAAVDVLRDDVAGER